VKLILIKFLDHTLLIAVFLDVMPCQVESY